MILDLLIFDVKNYGKESWTIEKYTNTFFNNKSNVKLKWLGFVHPRPYFRLAEIPKWKPNFHFQNHLTGQTLLILSYFTLNKITLIPIF